MAKKDKKERKPQPGSFARHERPPEAATGQAAMLAGAIFVGFSALMSLLLVLEHLGGLSLPGCGQGGPCEQATNSVWGRIQIGSFQWPVSYLGLAYFVAMLLTWLVCRGRLPAALRHLVRLGALISLGFSAIIFIKWMFCPYCVAAHLGNFAFWIVMELSGPRVLRAGPALATLGLAFAIVTGGIGLIDRQHRAVARQKGEQELAQATREIIERSRMPAEQSPTTRPGVTQAPATQPAVATPVVGQETTDQDADELLASRPAPPDRPIDPAATQLVRRAPEPAPAATGPAIGQRPFTGRYRWGPERAPIRIVMFTDYQCADCQMIERQVEQLMAERTDMSVSIKYFPFNRECNPLVGKDLHPNACWAARAAEAAGMLWGTEGFWKMHRWLMERKGSFETADELHAGIRSLGYDPANFVQTMSSPETLRRIQEDCQEADALGLHFTPMIFINGVELKGWYAEDAVKRAVAELAATNPPPRSPADDHPPLALEKYISDWRDQPVRQLPPDTHAWWLGPEQARNVIVLWGDYQEPYTAEADKIIRSFLAGRGDIRYCFRHCPFNSDCNPNIQERRHPNACRASAAAEAAGQLGGNAAYWKMHAWLMENQAQFSNEAVAAVAVLAGLDPDAVLARMDSESVREAIAEDVRAGKQLPVLRFGAPPGLHAIPSVFINGKYVPRVRLGGQSVLKEILDAAIGPEP